MLKNNWQKKTFAVLRVTLKEGIGANIQLKANLYKFLS